VSLDAAAGLARPAAGDRADGADALSVPPNAFTLTPRPVPVGQSRVGVVPSLSK